MYDREIIRGRVKKYSANNYNLNMVSFHINHRQPLNQKKPLFTLSKKAGLIMFLVVSVLFLIIGIYLMAKDYNAQKNWLPIEGEITFSQVYRKMSGGSSGSSKLMYGADLEYRYTFNEKEYLGHCCDESSSSISMAQKMIDHNPVGSKAEILVNPEEPYTSILKEGADPFRFGNLLWTGFSLLFVIIGIIQLFQKSTYLPEDNSSQTMNDGNETVKNGKIKN